MRLPEATLRFRNASASEDPANRRALGGGGPVRIQFRGLIPAQRPAIAVVNGAPAVTTNGRLVDASHPAAAGDIVTLYATGMVPVRQPPNPGEQFGGNPPPVIAVPVDVTLNGIAAELLYAGGYPGGTDGYQVNFRVPAGLTSGMAKLVVSNAWVPSARRRWCRFAEVFMRRRIELTRERWTRMSIPNAATSCPHNGPRREVMTVLQAARRVGIPAGMLERRNWPRASPHGKGAGRSARVPALCPRPGRGYRDAATHSNPRKKR